MDSAFLAAVESAKVQALYHFAYGLSHEINNPLANIATRAQTLLADEKDPERRRKLATIVQQAFRAHEMIADLMLFARPPSLRPEKTDLARLAETVVGEMHEQAREQGTQLVHLGGAESLVATVDATQIAVALKALVQNALEAVRTGGSVNVECDTRTLSTQYSKIPNPQSVPAPHFPVDVPHFFLTVSDTGPGIPPEVRAHIFDPFFSGREAGRGLGLGLSKAWRIVQLHGGRIEVDSEMGQGARFTIALPGGHFSATTGETSVPIPSIQASTRSPGLR